MPIAFDRITNEPQTHIFIIAAGGYPYLKGGAQEQATHDAQLNGLRQLTTPAATAVALYQQFIDFHDRGLWVAPLGSVRMLISAPPQVNLPAGLVYEEPTMDRIVRYYEDWFTACDGHQDNVAIFYFCGHGLEKGDHILLASDFNDFPRNPWRKAFSFDKTRAGFHGCRAQTQLFFGDACRMHTEDMRDLRLDVAGLDVGNISYGECQYDMTIRSAAVNQEAHGLANKPSHFARALINGLNGQCAMRNENQEWMIETNLLGPAIKEIMRNDPATAHRQVRTPVLLGDSRSILKVPSAPKIPLVVTCDPDTALAHATFDCSGDNGHTSGRAIPANEPYVEPLEPGNYKIRTGFTNQAYRSCEINTIVMPPLKKEKIRCK